MDRFRSQKEAALLAFLAHTGKTHQREFIADLLWDSSSTKQALSNLRTILTRLRKQHGDILVVTRKTVTVACGQLASVDSAQIQQALLNMGSINTSGNAKQLLQIVESYDGDFLAGFTLSNAPEFDDWVTSTREQIRRLLLDACGQLGQYARSMQEPQFGLAVARQWLKIDPFDEAASILLIECLLEVGRTREAIRHYEQVVGLLRDELGISPSGELSLLVREIMSAEPAGFHPPTPSLHNIPTSYDEFFGRTAEMQQIEARLDQSFCRLVTILGQGGVGKTRLSMTVARGRTGRYRDGVWLVELADIDEHDEDIGEAIAVEIATILEMRLSGSATPAKQLLDYLQHKNMLLLLDNFEHVLEGGAHMVRQLIEHCPGIQILITSREPLRLRSEWKISLTGLSYSGERDDDTDSEAVALFISRQKQQLHTPITNGEIEAAQTICRMVEGLPLAVELAAALTQYMSPKAIVANLENGFDSLSSSLRDLPERHKNLYIVFEMSWRTLTAPQQQQLASLSTFRGGFTVEAAQQVAGADLPHLGLLCEKSLVRHHKAIQRYSLHPVIHTYAAAKRSEADQSTFVHSSYFLALLTKHADALQQDAPQASMSLLELDSDNIRVAWQTGLEQRYGNELLAALSALSVTYQLRGLSHEGETIMAKTGKAAADWGSTGNALATRAGLELSRFQNRLGKYQNAINSVKRALAVASSNIDSWVEGMGYVLWGEALWRQGKYKCAEQKLALALAKGQSADSHQIVGWCHHHLGIIHDIQSRYTEALAHLKLAVDAWEAINCVQALTGTLNSIGIVLYHRGELDAAKKELERALGLTEQLNNRHLQASVLNNLSMIATEQADYSGAQYYLRLGINLAASSGNLNSQSSIQINIGKTYRSLGKIDAAIESISQGLQIAEKIGDHSLIASGLLNLAEAKREQGLPEQAESLFEQALQISQRGRFQSIECEVLIGMAENSTILNKTRAKQLVEQASTIATELQIPILLTRVDAMKHTFEFSGEFEGKSSRQIDSF